MTHFSDLEVSVQTGSFAERVSSKPLVVAFSCPHCAPSVKAFNDKASGLNSIELENIEMPCTGRIDNLHLMRTFEDGADGIIVAGCEPGRCYHATGNINAARRTKRVQGWLDEVGLGSGRLTMVHLPARDGERPFAEAARAVIKSVEDLGSSPLRTVTSDPSNQPAPEDAFLADLGLL
jgi:coenzyme F420-reducing hydrogenase delta subunit